MALITMAVHDTEENGRTKYTIETLFSLLKTVDFNKHRLIVIDNNSCNDTKQALKDFRYYFMQKNNFLFCNYEVITNDENLGTAKAVNKGIKKRKNKEYVIKMDNDVVHHNTGWVDEMEEAINRYPKFGILGCKRKDLEQRPDHETEYYKSELFMLPHNKGERWIISELANDIMGTCVMFNYKLIDAIGYLNQPTQYGWDDVDYSIRSLIAGFKNGFLPHLIIEHIDVGGDSYCEWKHKTAADGGEELQRLIKGYNNQTISIVYE